LFPEMRIALEPEAASIYCQSQPNESFKRLLQKQETTKYLVIDIGGKEKSIII